MAEWSNAADSKSVVPIGYRGFESLSLRHFFSASVAASADEQVEGLLVDRSLGMDLAA